MTNKLLLEAGFTRFMFRGGTTGRPAPDGIMDLIPVTEQSTAINPSTSLPYAPRANYVYRGVATANPNYANPNNWRASASYVTGSHEMKVGYQGAYIRVKNWFLVNEPQLAYRFNQGVPNQFTFRLPEWHQSDRTGTAVAVRPGQVDARPADAAGRVTLRPRLELHAGGAQRDGADVTIQRGADQLPADARRRFVQRHHAALRRRLRRVRQRQDGAEVQSRPLPRFGDERQRVHQQQSGRAHRAHGTRNWDDRIVPGRGSTTGQQGHRLRHHELRRQRRVPRGDRRRRELRRGLGQHHAGEPGDAARLGCPSERLAVGDHPAAGGDPARCRRRSPTTAGGSRAPR